MMYLSKIEKLYKRKGVGGSLSLSRVSSSCRRIELKWEQPNAASLGRDVILC